MPQRGGADQGHPDGPKDDPALRQDSHFSAAQTSQIRFSTTFDFQGLGLSCRLLSKALGWCCGFLTQALERCCWFLARALERCCWFLAQALGTWSPQQYALREVADEAVLSSARDEARYSGSTECSTRLRSGISGSCQAKIHVHTPVAEQPANRTSKASRKRG